MRELQRRLAEMLCDRRGGMALPSGSFFMDQAGVQESVLAALQDDNTSDEMLSALIVALTPCALAVELDIKDGVPMRHPMELVAPGYVPPPLGATGLDMWP